MYSTKQPSKTRRILNVLICASGLLMAGCAESSIRDDKLTLGSGDAVARNKVVHTIDPWPRHAEHTTIGGDGKRMVGAIERYQKPPPEKMGTKTTSPISSINK